MLMRSGGSVLKAPRAAEGALPREYEHEAAWRIPGEVLMRSGGSVLEAPPGAEEGALPRKHEHEAVWYTPTPRILSTKPLML